MNEILKKKIEKCTEPNHYTSNFKYKAFEWLRNLEGTREEEQYCDCIMRELINYRSILKEAGMEHKL